MLLTRNGDSYVVSVRAPKTKREGADKLCLVNGGVKVGHCSGGILLSRAA